MTIAIDLGGERSGSPGGASVGEAAEERPIDEWIERFRKSRAHLVDRDPVRSVMSRFGGAWNFAPLGDEPASPASEPLGSLPAGLSKFDVINQSFETMQNALTRYRLAADPPDVLVTIPRDACRTLDFARASDMIELGRDLTVEALDSSAFMSLSW